MLHHRVSTTQELDTTLSILNFLLERENTPMQKIQLDTISHTRLDKLLEDILHIRKNVTHSAITDNIFTTAHDLLEKWQKRFAEG